MSDYDISRNFQYGKGTKRRPYLNLHNYSRDKNLVSET